MPSLIERSKWVKRERNIQVGDIVLVVDHNTPRGQWPTGRVIKNLTSRTTKEKDPTVRTVIVMTDQGEYRRPVVKLCLLRTADQAEPGSAGEDVTDGISKATVADKAEKGKQQTKSIKHV